jgi:hypothetical protein
MMTTRGLSRTVHSATSQLIRAADACEPPCASICASGQVVVGCSARTYACTIGRDSQAGVGKRVHRWRRTHREDFPRGAAQSAGPGWADSERLLRVALEHEVITFGDGQELHVSHVTAVHHMERAAHRPHLCAAADDDEDAEPHHHSVRRGWNQIMPHRTRECAVRGPYRSVVTAHVCTLMANLATHAGHRVGGCRCLR